MKRGERERERGRVSPKGGGGEKKKRGKVEPARHISGLTGGKRRNKRGRSLNQMWKNCRAKPSGEERKFVVLAQKRGGEKKEALDCRDICGDWKRKGKGREGGERDTKVFLVKEGKRKRRSVMVGGGGKKRGGGEKGNYPNLSSFEKKGRKFSFS